MGGIYLLSTNNYSRKIIFSIYMEVVKLLIDGLIGSMTFGMYWSYKSLKAIEANNKIQNDLIKKK